LDTDQLAKALQALAADSSSGQAWEDLYRLLWPMLIAMHFRALNGNRTRAEEAADEVMYRILKHAKFDADHADAAGFLSYVNSVSRSALIDLYRREDRASALPEDPQQAEELAASDGSLEAQQVTRDLVEKVADRLGDDERQLAARLMEGYSAEDLAKALNITTAAAYKRIARLKQKIQEVRRELEAKPGF